MAIRIVQEGAVMPIPEDAYLCPNCGHRAKGFEIKRKIYIGNELLCQAPLCPIMLPTFDCERCRCIWQWEKDSPKPCPKCGGMSLDEVEVTPAEIRGPFSVGKPPEFAIQCKDCGFTGPAAIQAPDILNGWNELPRARKS